MNSRISIGFTALGCILLASCYPYDESARRTGRNSHPPEKSVSSAEQQKLKEQRELAKKQDELKKKEAEITSQAQTTPPTNPNPSPEAPKPPAPEKKDFAYAQKVPGKEGFVFSPFNNKVIDVRDIPSGTLVQDPTYPASEMKRFRVP